MILFRSRPDRPNVLKVYGCAFLLAVKRPAEQIIGLQRVNALVRSRVSGNDFHTMCMILHTALGI
jgi:hypothetical protein